MRWLVEQIACVSCTPRMTRDLRRLALLATLLVAIDALAIATHPPVEADAYEYASVARSLVETGTLTENHLRGYHFDDPRPMELPHAGAHRAGLHVFLLAPFHVLFGSSWLTLAVPHLLAVWALPLLLYLGALGLFGRRTAFRTAWLVPLFPRVLFYAGMEDAGLPDWPHWGLLTVVPGMLLARRYGRAGVIVGLATLLKSSGLLVMPAWFAWALIYDRRRLFEARWLLLPVAFLVTLSPYGVRNTLVFGKPVYSEDVGRWAKEPPEKSISMQHMLEPIAGGPFRPGETEPANVELPFPTTVEILAFGRHSDHGYYPGLPGLLGWPFVPFFVVGLWRSIRGSPRRALGAFHVGVHTSVFVLFLMVEDRYLFPVLAPCVAIALTGLDAVSRRVPRITPKLVIAFFLLTETLPLVGSAVERGTRGEGREAMRELEAIGATIAEETGPDDVLMTVPFWSPHYLFERPTVPFPWADVATIRRIVGHYQVRALVLDHRMLPDQVREPGPVDSVAEGRYLSLRMLDPARVSEAPPGAPAALEAIHALDVYHRDRVHFPVYPSLPWALRGATGSVVAAAAIWLALAAAWLALPRRGPARWLVGAALPVATWATGMVALAGAYGETQPYERPRIAEAEIAATLDAVPPAARRRTGATARALETRLAELAGDGRVLRRALDSPGAPRCVLLVAPPALRPLLVDAEEVRAARERDRMRRGRARAIAERIRGEGHEAHAIGAHVIVPVDAACEGP